MVTIVNDLCVETEESFNGVLFLVTTDAERVVIAPNETTVTIEDDDGKKAIFWQRKLYLKIKAGPEPAFKTGTSNLSISEIFEGGFRSFPDLTKYLGTKLMSHMCIVSAVLLNSLGS